MKHLPVYFSPSGWLPPWLVAYEPGWKGPLVQIEIRATSRGPSGYVVPAYFTVPKENP